MQQLTLYHRINFLRRFDSFFPLFVAIAAHYHINIAQVFLLESTFALSMMLSEIPTGYYSDRYNRTDCLLFGCWMFCFSCILYLTWANFWCWALANMFSGIAYACFSGSDTALLYEWLHEDQSQSYMAHESRMQAWSRYAEGVSAFLGAAMLYLHPLLPVFAFLVSKLTMTAHMYSFLRANDKATTSSATTARSTQSIKTFISQCKLFIAQVRPDGGLSLLVCSSILNCIMFVFFWILQAQLVILEISLFATGLYWLIFFGCAGFVSMCCGNIDRHIRSEWMLMQLVIALYACVLFLIACTWLKPHAALWWLSGFALIVGIKLPLFNLLINQKIMRQNRATFHSVDSVLSRLLFSATMPITGWLLTTGILHWLWAGWFVFALFGFAFTLNYKKMQLFNDK